MPWSGVHINFADPFQGQISSIVADSFSKWLEVVPVASMSSHTRIQVLKTFFFENFFPKDGLPDTIVSDNDAQFTLEEFKK